MDQNQKMVADKICEIIVDKLKLPVKPEEISLQTSLFNADGLGLDSVDALEIVASVDEEYGVSLTSEHREHFQNIEKLSGLIVDLIAAAGEKKDESA